MPDTLTPAEQRRQKALQRKQQVSAEIVDATTAPMRSLSFMGSVLQQAMPPALLQKGLVAYESTGQPRVGLYHPSLLAPNPQRGRLIDRGLEELARSMDSQGQQEPILARLITEFDRQRWPDRFIEDQLLLILTGHRLFFAHPKSKLPMLKVELLLREEGESDQDYIRRGLRRASIKIVHSQAYTILDKVHQYMLWREEFALEEPKDGEVAAYFEVSRTEAQRLKVVSTLNEEVTQDIVNAENRLADEVVYLIANRPPDEQRDALKKYGNLTVAAARELSKMEKRTEQIAAPLGGAGRPRNFALHVSMEGSPITAIYTSLTPQQWKQKGGAKAFWELLRKLVHSKEVQDQLKDDLS